MLGQPVPRSAPVSMRQRYKIAALPAVITTLRVINDQHVEAVAYLCGRIADALLAEDDRQAAERGGDGA
jgi:hypothetical protein